MSTRKKLKRKQPCSDEQKIYKTTKELHNFLVAKTSITHGYTIKSCDVEEVRKAIESLIDNGRFFHDLLRFKLIYRCVLRVLSDEYTDRFNLKLRTYQDCDDRPTAMEQRTKFEQDTKIMRNSELTRHYVAIESKQKTSKLTYRKKGISNDTEYEERPLKRSLERLSSMVYNCIFDFAIKRFQIVETPHARLYLIGSIFRMYSRSPSESIVEDIESMLEHKEYKGLPSFEELLKEFICTWMPIEMILNTNFIYYKVVMDILVKELKVPETTIRGVVDDDILIDNKQSFETYTLNVHIIPYFPLDLMKIVTSYVTALIM